MINFYIISNKKHCDMLIRAESEVDCCDTFAQELGYKNYREMLEKLGRETARADVELICQEN